jgi:hypothetical protein
MALYTQGGDRKWHAVDRAAVVQGRVAHATKCGRTVVCSCPSEERESAPADLCALCAVASCSDAVRDRLKRRA